MDSWHWGCLAKFFFYPIVVQPAGQAFARKLGHARSAIICVPLISVGEGGLYWRRSQYNVLHGLFVHTTHSTGQLFGSVVVALTLAVWWCWLNTWLLVKVWCAGTKVSLFVLFGNWDRPFVCASGTKLQCAYMCTRVSTAYWIWGKLYMQTHLDGHHVFVSKTCCLQGSEAMAF